MLDGQRGCAADHQPGQRERQAARQRHGGDHHRREEQHDKRVLDPAGEKQESRKLQNVEGEQGRRRPIGEPMRTRQAQTQSNVQRRGNGDGEQAWPDRQIEAQAEEGAENGGGLAGNGEPAQPHQGIDPQARARAGQDRCH